MSLTTYLINTYWVFFLNFWVFLCTADRTCMHHSAAPYFQTQGGRNKVLMLTVKKQKQNRIPSKLSHALM